MLVALIWPRQTISNKLGQKLKHRSICPLSSLLTAHLRGVPDGNGGHHPGFLRREGRPPVRENDKRGLTGALMLRPNRLAPVG